MRGKVVNAIKKLVNCMQSPVTEVTFSTHSDLRR